MCDSSLCDVSVCFTQEDSNKRDYYEELSFVRGIDPVFDHCLVQGVRIPFDFPLLCVGTVPLLQSAFGIYFVGILTPHLSFLCLMYNLPSHSF